MADVRQGRWTAEIDGDFVVFIIGARINSKLHAFRGFVDLGGRRGMNHMLTASRRARLCAPGRTRRTAASGGRHSTSLISGPAAVFR